MKKVIAITLFAILGARVSPALAGWGAPDVRIQAVHTEIRNGAPAFVAYFIDRYDVIALNNLDRPDIQLLKSALDAAFAQNKLITFAQNRSRNSRTAAWYDLTDAPNASIGFFDIYSGDQAFFRVKP